jgi:hypothetical protein
VGVGADLAKIGGKISPFSSPKWVIDREEVIIYV